jgi:hypothetical protein
MDKEEIKIKVFHYYRGEGYITEGCFYLQQINPDPTSVFVEFTPGEPEEVTKNLIRYIDKMGS